MLLRRAVACSAAALVAVASASSAAPPPPHIVDARDDWKVPSQDVLSGVFSTLRDGRVAVSLTMAAPLAEVPGSYYVGFTRGCQGFLAVFSWRGAALPRESEFRVIPCDSSVAPLVGTYRSEPVAVTVSGATVTWTLPKLTDLAKGTRLQYAYAVAAPNPGAILGVYAGGSGAGSGAVEAYDVGYGNRDYVVGKG